MALAIATGDIGFIILILGIVLVLFSIPKTSYSGTLRSAGEIIAILGAIIFIVQLLFGV